MITLTDISLQRGVNFLLERTSAAINPGQRVGIIGRNGTGKSSLFKLLLGELQLDRGDLGIPAQWRIAHMAQEVGHSERSALDYVLDGDVPLRAVEEKIAKAESSGDHNALAHLYEEYDHCGGYSAVARAEQLLHGLGFSQAEVSRPVNSFSGGWRIRLNLAQALMCPSDLMLLDEPTNHLDLDATVWLEQWLNRYPGTLLLISHDRDFLDNVVNQVIHIEHQKLNSYSGNYSAYERQRAERLAQQQVMYEKQQAERAHMQDFVRRFKAKASKAKQAQSRIKALERMELIAPAHIDSPFHFYFYEADKYSTPLVQLSEASLGYGDKTILRDVHLRLTPGDRVGLLGPNGAGKSTLIKSLVGDLKLQAGERMTGEHLKIGYFAQHQLEALDLNASAYLHIQRISPRATEQEIRNFLGGFNFHGDKALDPIAPFSGGEKARLALAIVVWQKPNLLLLDEPTNHLDLDMRHALTVALQSFNGALVVISHDRHLLKNSVDQFYTVFGGEVEEFSGALEDYYKWINQQLSATSQQTAAKSESGNPKKHQRQQSAEQRRQLQANKNQLKKLEAKLEKESNALAEVEQQLADPDIYSDNRKVELEPLLLKQAQLQNAIGKLEEEWMELTEVLEG